MTISTPYPYTLTNGTTADATQVMANFIQIQNDVNANGAHSGANGDITALTGLTTPIAPGSGGTVTYTAAVATNIVNAFTVTTTVPAAWNNIQGNILEWIPNATNTAGTSTLTVNTKTTKNVKKINTAGAVVDIAAGDIVANVQSVVMYDGTQFILLNPIAGATASAASLVNTSYGTTAGGTTVYTITTTPSFAAFTQGQIIDATFNATSTGAVTLNPNGIGATAVVDASGTALPTGALQSGKTYPLLYDGASLRVLTPIMTTGIVSVKRQVYTGNGTHTPSAGALFSDVEALGGGGGGGTNGTGATGGGGQAGSYSRSLITAATMGASQVVTIGIAGTAGANTGGTGGTGGATSLGALVTAPGGIGGTGSANGAGTNGGVVAGGTGAVAGTGTIATPGGSGFGANFEVSSLRNFGGNGANSNYGSGGAGATALPSAGQVGNAATGFGAGGGGATGATRLGGVGTAGIIVVTEYCSQ